MATIGQDLLNVPMGDMIRQMAFAIADAQGELDESSMYVAEMMSGRRLLRDAEGKPANASGNPVGLNETPEFVDTRIYFGYDVDDKGVRTPARVSMLELGFTPVFYHFIETLIEVKIAIKITQENSFTKTTKGTETKISTSNLRRRGWLWGGGVQITTTPVDATYSSKYTYTAEGSSLLRTKMVPVPPPAILEERIRFLLEQERRAQQAEAQKADEAAKAAESDKAGEKEEAKKEE